MTPSARPSVFLAHARADLDLLPEIDAAARSAGLLLWSESAGSPDDEDVRAALTRAIGECSVFAVLLTARSMQRSWVRWELEYAVSIGKAPILAIVGEPDLAATPPFDRLRREAYLPLRPAGALASRLAALVPAAPVRSVSVGLA
jgi:TIR domain